ncbi:hypothetical protein ABID99_000725 [Mucilaginibacter sp. OAE612]|uniref:hypothetical protein n=1 Tax=Mucilaginibacter sp. OAE612 TaxID=3156444 RepID=UPI00359E75A8
MTEYAVVLQNNMVVKSPDFGNLETFSFTKDGKVKEFTYQNVKYYAVFSYSTRLFIDYVDALKFDALLANEKKRVGASYDGVSTNLWKNPKAGFDITFNKYANLTKAVDGDTIYGYLRDETGLCFNYYIWNYTSPYNGPSKFTKAPNASQTGLNCETFKTGSLPKNFYDAFNGKSFYDLNSGLSSADQRLVGEVASLMNSVDQNILKAFQGFTAAGVNTGEFIFSQNNDGYYSRQEILDYKKGLERWLEIYNANQEKLNAIVNSTNRDPETANAEKLYIICDTLYRYNMLANLTVPQKIGMLKVLSQDALMNWYFASFKNGFQQRETLTVKIIESVTSTQADDFLKALLSTQITSTSYTPGVSGVPGTSRDVTSTLYKNLFLKIDDYFEPDNFTAFIKALQRLVLAKNGILLPAEVNKIDYTIDQLKAKTDKLFLWGNIRNANKLKYSVSSQTDQKITFSEAFCTRISKVEVQNSNSLGIPTNSSYTISRCASYQQNKIEVGHFDLVGIYFYDNPSFIDLGEDTSHKEQAFLTFGGFVDYLLAKEDTKLVEKIINAGLTALIMTVGLGEIVGAIRGVNYVRLLAGIGTTIGDVTQYLAQDSDFRNYIIEKYPEDHDKILTIMQLGGAVLTIGGVSAIGSGIFKTYSVSQASEFLGIGRQVLADADALAKLTANERLILENGIKIFENGLYRIKYSVEISQEVNRAKTIIKFYDSTALRSGIFALDETSKLKFLDYFYELSDELTVFLKDAPQSVEVWGKLDDAGKLIIKSDFESWIKGFKARPLLKTEQYAEVSQLFNKTISPAYETASIPGVKWIVDGTPDIDALIDANKIANNSSDIAKISSNYGIPVNVMTRVKEHFWIKEHFILVENGTYQIGRFERLESDVLEWKAAINNTLSGNDLETFKRLMAHEYVESQLMERGLSYRALNKYLSAAPSDLGAHEMAPIDKIGDQYYLQLNRRLDLPQPPTPDLDTFSNLDQIVNFFVNFYNI